MHRCIITEEMRVRQMICEYSKKYGVRKAARKYQTNRMFVYRLLKRWDGGIRSLSFKTHRPHSHPNSHSCEELSLITRMYDEHWLYGFAEVYVRSRALGYTRSFGSMCGGR